MNILIAGATGKTGLRLVNELLNRGHQPIALVRDSSNTAKLPMDVQLREGDLAELPDDICDGCDAVIFAAGSGGDTGEDMTDKIDRDGAERLIDIAEQAGVKRFVMLSSFGAGDPKSTEQLEHYLTAKHDADEHLKDSGMQYAILRPVALTNDDGERDMTFGDDVSADNQAARGDVADILARMIDEDSWLGKATPMQSETV